MNKKELLEKLQIPDAFKGFQVLEDTKLWGWNGDRPIFPELVRTIKPKVVIEVGSWMGLSATNLAKSMEHLGMSDSVLLCVDTWLGSREHWNDPELRQHLELENGRPTFYKRFLSNIKKAKLEDWVVPLNLPSRIAGTFLNDKGVKAELIYLDGSHLDRDVFEDLMLFWELLEPGGAVFGDDWPWESVQDGVKAFCAEVGVPYSVHEINWIIRKS